MAAASVSTIRTVLFLIASEFSTEDTAELARVDGFITLAINRINRTRWGTKADEGTAWIAAHLLKRAEEASAGNTVAGPISKKKVGDMEVTYQSSSSSANNPDALYLTTPYGQEYLNLKAGIAGGPLILGSS
jgi:hypothetical protein